MNDALSHPLASRVWALLLNLCNFGEFRFLSSIFVIHLPHYAVIIFRSFHDQKRVWFCFSMESTWRAILFSASHMFSHAFLLGEV